MEHGFTNPRLSLGGRISMDSSWSGERLASPTSARRSHSRQLSGNRSNSNGGFSFSRVPDEESGLENGSGMMNGGVKLTKLSEDPREDDYDHSDDDELEAVNESTALRTMRKSSPGGRRPGSGPSTPIVGLPR